MADPINPTAPAAPAAPAPKRTMKRRQLPRAQRVAVKVVQTPAAAAPASLLNECHSSNYSVNTSVHHKRHD